ncbi:uncharacterized protein [Mytilus edulis]|uniref:uncharacterized protein n=1 Tax=Mytilus edulis TaxID=6550 RepID=UPI0039EFD527
MVYTFIVKFSFLPILSFFVLSTSASDGLNFWDAMKQLDEMNREILQQKSHNQNDTVAEVPSTTVPQESTLSYSTSLDFDNKVTTETATVHDNSQAEYFSAQPTTEHGTKVTRQSEEIKTSSRKQSDSLSPLLLSTDSKMKPDISSTQANSVRNTNAKKLTVTIMDEKVARDILLYAGVACGSVLACICILILVIVRRKRMESHKEKHLEKRFSATDQRTYKDTKIFVMSKTGKGGDIINAFDAIPTNTYLWKELQSSTPNVF